DLVRGDDVEALPAANAGLLQRGVRVRVTDVEGEVELLLVLHLGVEVRADQQGAGAARHVEPVEDPAGLHKGLRDATARSGRDLDLVVSALQGAHRTVLQATANGAGLSGQQLAPA